MDSRSLNRALLARQHLLGRVCRPAPAAVEPLLGLQPQTPTSAYLALWSRIDGFEPAELSLLLEARAAVRLPLMRSTVHLVNARDCRVLRPLVQPVLDRELAGC